MSYGLNVEMHKQVRVTLICFKYLTVKYESAILFVRTEGFSKEISDDPKQSLTICS